MAPQDARHRRALELRRHDEFGVAQRDGLGAGDAGVRRPGGDRDGEDRVLDPRLQRGDEGEREDQPRERHEDVGDAHQHEIDDPAGIARDRADQEPDRPDDDGDEADDQQRHARAGDDAGEDVAAEIVGAEPMRGAGRHQALVQILIVHRPRPEQRRQHRRDHEQRHQSRPDQRQPVRAEDQPAPHTSSRAAPAAATAAPRQAATRGGRGADDRRRRSWGGARGERVRPSRRAHAERLLRMRKVMRLAASEDVRSSLRP